jgi:hypothetical protein
VGSAFMGVLLREAPEPELIAILRRMCLMRHPKRSDWTPTKSKYDVICHLLSSGCAEPCLFLGTDAYPLRPQPAPLGPFL